MQRFFGTTLAAVMLLGHTISTIRCRAVEVSTTSGKVIGADTLRTRNGRVIYSFTGIPYAKPPTGKLRFMEPQPVDPWETPFDATKNGPACVNVNIITEYGSLEYNPPIFGQEDCLILNVYSPKVDKAAKLPVILFIHGGGFSQGLGGIYGPEFLLDKDVVLVNFNHRLFLFGFLGSGDGVIPANVGLKDQALVIRWVHDNIANFGGDPNLVTLMGESSGGASVHLNLLSPLNKGLIHRGIAMSGTGLNTWAVSDPHIVKNRTLTLAKLSGCPPDPSGKLLQCLQTVNPTKLIQSAKTLQDWLISPAVLFGPTIETNTKNAFLPAHPIHLDSNVPLITGISSAEGALFASVLFAAGGQYEKDLQKRPLDILPSLLMLSSKFPDDKISAVSKEILRYYFSDRSIGRSTTREIIDMVTDDWFFIGTVESVANYGGRVYFYYYDYPQSVSFSRIFGTGEIKSVCHTDILLNLFPLRAFFPQRSLSKTDIMVSEKMIDIWTDFAVNGTPSRSLMWEPTAKTTKITKYLHITAGALSMKENLLSERVEFWNSLRASNPKADY